MVSGLMDIVQCSNEVAQRCLQQNDWDQQRAINAYVTDPDRYQKASGTGGAGSTAQMGEDQQMAMAMQ